MNKRSGIGKAKVARSRTASGPVALPAEAARLLDRLGEAGAYARRDPLSEDGLLVRRGGDGVSVGSGRFSRDAGRQLTDADLAAWDPARTRLTIGPAGQARLRRAQAPDGLAYLAQHHDLSLGGASEPTLRNVSENPLSWMVRRRGGDGAPLIDPASFEAGERLRRDMTTAAMLPRMGSELGAPRVDGGGARDPAAASDQVIAARQRVRGALDAVGGDLSGLLIDLCGFLKGLERIETERRWPARSAKVVARIALGRLAEHYGLAREATGPDHGRMRLWRA